MQDPWQRIEKQIASGGGNAARVDPTIPWDLFWHVDSKGQCALILEHQPGSVPNRKILSLKGLDLKITAGSFNQERLTLALIDGSFRDVFVQLCADIVNCCTQSPSEAEAVQTFLRRAMRWHRLLSGKAADALTDEEEAGLFGELIFLSRHLMPRYAHQDAVEFWRGPHGHPKDFEYAGRCVEVKTRRSSARRTVAISSADQLSPTSGDLFLYVLELTAASEGAPDAVTISDVVREIKETLGKSPSVLEAFELSLAVAGYVEDKMRAKPWLIDSESAYTVVDGFPRITADAMLLGVSDVRYNVNLDACAPYRTDLSALLA